MGKHSTGGEAKDNGMVTRAKHRAPAPNPRPANAVKALLEAALKSTKK